MYFEFYLFVKKKFKFFFSFPSQTKIEKQFIFLLYQINFVILTVLDLVLIKVFILLTRFQKVIITQLKLIMLNTT